MGALASASLSNYYVPVNARADVNTKVDVPINVNTKVDTGAIFATVIAIIAILCASGNFVNFLGMCCVILLVYVFTQQPQQAPTRSDPAPDTAPASVPDPRVNIWHHFPDTILYHEDIMKISGPHGFFKKPAALAFVKNVCVLNKWSGFVLSPAGDCIDFKKSMHFLAARPQTRESHGFEVYLVENPSGTEVDIEVSEQWECKRKHILRDHDTDKIRTHGGFCEFFDDAYVVRCLQMICEKSDFGGFCMTNDGNFVDFKKKMPLDRALALMDRDSSKTTHMRA